MKKKKEKLKIKVEKKKMKIFNFLYKVFTTCKFSFIWSIHNLQMQFIFTFNIFQKI